jgi:hypothetical protein
MNSIIDKIKWQAYLTLMRDHGGDERNTLFLAGEGRSGTTWISNMINAKQKYRDIFEPFNRLYNLNQLLFLAHHYFEPDQRYPEHYKVAERILRGKVKSVVIDFNNRGLLYKKRLVKEITASMYLKWLHIQFPDMPMIYIFRFPLAIAYSRVKRGWGIFDRDLISEPAIQKFLVDKLDVIEELDLNHPFLNQVFSVCLNHYIVLQDCRDSNILLLFYEDFKRDPLRNLQRIEAHTRHLIDKAAASQASEGAGFSHGKMLHNREVINKMAGEFGSEVISDALWMMQIFGLDKMYDQSGQPKDEITIPNTSQFHE